VLELRCLLPLISPVKVFNNTAGNSTAKKDIILICEKGVVVVVIVLTGITQVSDYVNKLHL
jgi:hypothetical protein